MNNRDRKEEAGLAQAAEQYGAALTAFMQAQMEKTREEPFPEALDARCRGLLKQEWSPNQEKPRHKMAARGVRYAAVLAVTLVLVFSVLFVTVEAVRAPILEFFELREGYWLFWGKGTPAAQDAGLSDPLTGLIPEAYRLTLLEIKSPAQLTAIYENPTGEQVFFSVTSSDSRIAVDTEGALISKQIRVCGCEGIFVVHNRQIRMAWVFEERATAFTLLLDGMTEEEAFGIAEGFMERIGA